MFDFRFPFGYLNKDFVRGLSQNDEPPTLYSLMNSYVNFNKPDEEKVAIIDLPAAFKEYLFDFDYPLDEELKPTFEENFLTHYLMRRIGFETYMAFKIQLKAKLNDIMYKYNHLLKEITELDFLGTKETHTRVVTSSSASSSNGTSSTTNDNRYSDTPQNQLTDVQEGTYMTDYTYNQQTGSSSSSASGQARNDETITIHRGDSTDEYINIQEKVSNVYSLIYKELDCLFFGII